LAFALQNNFNQKRIMDFDAKQKAYQLLQGEKHLEADRALLEHLCPTSKALRGLPNPDREVVQRGLLWELLDSATPEQIREHRHSWNPKAGTIPGIPKPLPKKPAAPEPEKKKSPAASSRKAGSPVSSKRGRVSKD
jgi:hypothetical protein